MKISEPASETVTARQCCAGARIYSLARRPPYQKDPEFLCTSGQRVAGIFRRKTCVLQFLMRESKLVKTSTLNNLGPNWAKLGHKLIWERLQKYYNLHLTLCRHGSAALEQGHTFRQEDSLIKISGIFMHAWAPCGQNFTINNKLIW